MTLVLAAVADLFFASKIRATASSMGVDVRFMRSINSLVISARETKPDLVIVDLQSTNLDPIALAKTLQSDEALRSVPLVGFYSHLLRDLQSQAQQAGYSHVMPRSAFTNKLADVLAGKL